MKGYSSTLIQVIPFLFALAAIYFSIKKGRITKDEIAWQRPRSRFLMMLWILGFALISIVIELLLYSHGMLSVKPWDLPVGAIIIRSIGIIILAPLTEELFLRGIVLSKLKQKGLKTILAVIAQAMIFVLLHGFTYDGTPESRMGIVQTFTDGCLFAFARLHTRSIVTSVGMHMAGNTIAVLERILG
jgi:membrane protease YdiL (CAAX protease family)